MEAARQKEKPATRTSPGRGQARAGVKQGPWSKGAPVWQECGDARPRSSRLGPDPPARTCRAPPHLHVWPRLPDEALQPCGRQLGEPLHFQRNRSRQAGQMEAITGGKAGEVGARRGWEGQRWGGRTRGREDRPALPDHRGLTSKVPALTARGPHGQMGRARCGVRKGSGLGIRRRRLWSP